MRTYYYIINSECSAISFPGVAARLSLIREAVLINPDFEGLSDIQKLCFRFSDSQIVRERGGLVVEHREVLGSIPTRVNVLCP